MSYSSLPTFAFQLSKCASSLIHSAPVTHYNFLGVGYRFEWTTN